MHKKLILLLLLLSMPGLAAADFLTPFKAEYKLVEPAKAKAVQSLELTSDGNWLFTSAADHFLISIRESSLFRIDGDQLIPIEYRQERKGLGRNRSKSNTFDWSSMTSRYTRSKGRDKQEGEFAIDEHTKDNLLFQLQLRLDVKQAMADKNPDQQFIYSIADNDHTEVYTFVITGEEQLETPRGDLKTVRLERVREDSNRQTLIWLAKDHDYLMVRLQQLEEDDKGFDLQLESF